MIIELIECGLARDECALPLLVEWMPLKYKRAFYVTVTLFCFYVVFSVMPRKLVLKPGETRLPGEGKP